MTARAASPLARALLTTLLAGMVAAGCRRERADERPRATGYVEATEVRVAADVGGRVLEMRVAEGETVAAGDPIARLDTAGARLAVRRLEAERALADAQLRLLQAGARAEEVRQARAQVESAEAEVGATVAEEQSATLDLQRFEGLLRSNAGSRKQRDDAATRQQVASARVTAARQRATAAAEGLGRLRAGARSEEIAGARARVAAVDAQLASLQKTITDAEVRAPVGGVVTATLVDAGETVAPGAPLVVVTDLAHAWANLYVDEPVVPTLRLGQAVAILTDAGHRLDGAITFISPRAEFTPRNVQTADERSRLVYRIKVTTDNRAGVLKSGMPVEGRF